MSQMFFPDFVFTSERPHYSLALFSSFIHFLTVIINFFLNSLFFSTSEILLEVLQFH